MRILHIAGDYPYTAVYHRLLSRLSESGCGEHVVYIPLAHGRAYTHKYDLDSPRAKTIYVHDHHRLERPFYGRRAAHTVRGVGRTVSGSFDLVHAHTAVSTGAAAHLMHQLHGIPYVVSVRASDIVTTRVFPHTRRLAASILSGASAIACLSPVLRDRLIKRCVRPIDRPSLLAKCHIIPNGVDDYWLDNAPVLGERRLSDQVRLLFVGELIQRKHVEASAALTRILTDRGRPAVLTVVGSGPEGAKVAALAEAPGHRVNHQPWTESRDELLRLYREADAFVMLSDAETFGLVYIESLSQGTPVLYVPGEGIDGYFADGDVGFACSRDRLDRAAMCVERILSEGDAMRERCVQAAQRFRWSTVAAEWAAIYERAAARGAAAVS